MNLEIQKLTELDERIKELYLKEYKLGLNESSNTYITILPSYNDSDTTAEAIAQLISAKQCAVILLSLANIHDAVNREDIYEEYKELLYKYNYTPIDISSVDLKTNTYAFGMFFRGLLL